jgi:hypothetical protein
VITFLPFPDFARSAAALDRMRLGKQRIEAKQLLEGLLGLGSLGTRSHPASVMWKGFESALRQYGVAICDEWIQRGYADSVRASLLGFVVPGDPLRMPPWFGVSAFHASHRSRLIFKDRDHYAGRLGWSESPLDPYLWPIAATGQVVAFRIGTTNGIVQIPCYAPPWDPQSKHRRLMT